MGAKKLRKLFARHERLFNRELSWLAFNERVLDSAVSSRVPLLERVRFLGITASNLDEFFMVRVGGLQRLADAGVAKSDPSGMSVREQLAAIDTRVAAMVKRQYRCWNAELEPALAEEGLRRVRAETLTEEQRLHCEQVFERELLPVLTPVAFDRRGEMPLVANRGLYLAVRLRGSGKAGAPSVALVQLPRVLNRLVSLPGEEREHRFILLEDVVALFVGRFFAGEQPVEVSPFRITRNADLELSEDQAPDLLATMEAVIEARKRSDCVRLELDSRSGPSLGRYLCASLGVAERSVYRVDGPLDLSALSALCGTKGCERLLYEPWQAQLSPEVPPAGGMFKLIGQRDVLLVHPFDSFEPVVRFVQEAAADPDVLAIKQVLYRVSRNSPVIAALIAAAERGIYVTALVELKARFDEERNIEWARELEDAGVQVIHGVRGLKTHSKICLVVRREAGGLRRYMHLGTGNYNEITARLYTDVSYLTADEDLGTDASAFFNAISGRSQPQPFHKLAAAPFGLRERIVELIEGEIERRRQGHAAWIMAKMNSLVDERIIHALYEASRAGVRIELNVRGICCLRPGVAGLSENIRVVSVVDRFLEHSRVFCFWSGGRRRVFISSADWMPRNLDRRVELLVPVEDPRCRDRLISVLETCLADTVNGWELRSDGRWVHRAPSAKRVRLRSQEELWRQARRAVQGARRSRTMLEPHRPKPVRR
jgi:polyphosphate kinase